MALILNIETVTMMGTINIAKDGEILGSMEVSSEPSLVSNLAVAIEELTKKTGISLKQLDAVAIVTGPGSYTSLRVGMSTAKGLCFALNLPLIGITTFDLLIGASMKAHPGHDNLHIAMLDARRMDVYLEGIADNGEIVIPSGFATVGQEWFEHVRGRNLVLSGDGSMKCYQLIGENENVVFSGIVNSAALATHISEQKVQDKVFEDIAYLIPNYIKPPNITQAKT